MTKTILYLAALTSTALGMGLVPEKNETRPHRQLQAQEACTCCARSWCEGQPYFVDSNGQDHYQSFYLHANPSGFAAALVGFLPTTGSAVFTVAKHRGAEVVNADVQVRIEAMADNGVDRTNYGWVGRLVQSPAANDWLDGDIIIFNYDATPIPALALEAESCTIGGTGTAANDPRMQQKTCGYGGEPSKSLAMWASTNGNRPPRKVMGGYSAWSFNQEDNVHWDRSCSTCHHLPLDMHFVRGTNLPYLSVTTWFKTQHSSTRHFSENWGLIDFDRSEFFNLYTRPDGRLGMSCRVAGTNLMADVAAGDVNNAAHLVNDNEWKHGALVLGDAVGPYVKIYLNGVALPLHTTFKQGQRTVAGPSTLSLCGGGATTYGMIGDGSSATSADGTNMGTWFSGDMAKLNFFPTRALTGAEVLQDYMNKPPMHMTYELGIPDTDGNAHCREGTTQVTRRSQCQHAIDTLLPESYHLLSDTCTGTGWWAGSQCNGCEFADQFQEADEAALAAVIQRPSGCYLNQESALVFLNDREAEQGAKGDASLFKLVCEVKVNDGDFAVRDLPVVPCPPEEVQQLECRSEVGTVTGSPRAWDTARTLTANLDIYRNQQSYPQAFKNVPSYLVGKQVINGAGWIYSSGLWTWTIPITRTGKVYIWFQSRWDAKIVEKHLGVSGSGWTLMPTETRPANRFKRSIRGGGANREFELTVYSKDVQAAAGPLSFAGMDNFFIGGVIFGCSDSD